MTGTLSANYALVRGLPSTYEKCLTSLTPREPIDLSLARRQHSSYCGTLETLGLELVWVEPADSFPDCCFIEDPAIVTGDTAIISRMGVPSRRGEEAAVRDALRPFKTIREIISPGTLEGGDVLQVEEQIYVGMTGRTNRSGLEQLKTLVSELSFEVIPVEVAQGLHLKSSCTYLGNGYVVLVKGRVQEGIFSEYNTIEVPPEEAPAADCLRVRDRVLVPEGYHATKRQIEAAGFETMALEMSEFEKCEGASTCLSIIF